MASQHRAASEPTHTRGTRHMNSGHSTRSTLSTLSTPWGAPWFPTCTQGWRCRDPPPSPAGTRPQLPTRGPARLGRAGRGRPAAAPPPRWAPPTATPQSGCSRSAAAPEQAGEGGTQYSQAAGAGASQRPQLSYNGCTSSNRKRWSAMPPIPTPASVSSAPAAVHTRQAQQPGTAQPAASPFCLLPSACRLLLHPAYPSAGCTPVQSCATVGLGRAAKACRH